MPFRVLAFHGGGGAQAVYTTADFIRIRHGLTESQALASYKRTIETIAGKMERAAPLPINGLHRDYGILSLTSAYGFDETVQRLRYVVMSQGDTVWFGEVDFAAEALTMGTELTPAVLLLFGGPAPGGVAMADFPSIGLDAFCQKLLVYIDGDGRTMVIYNSIVSLAELHYGRSAKPHAVLDKRLTETFSRVIAAE
jgi:uncharacterized protein (DUF302 family)